MFSSLFLILFSMLDLSGCEQRCEELCPGLWSVQLPPPHLGIRDFVLQLPPEWKVWATGFWLKAPCTKQPLHLNPGSLVLHQPFCHLHIPSVGHMEPQTLPILQEAMKHQ